eukprot:INCI6845.1.p1 GENE.INCI6845.1~~INCI6845.1.p1  ORF type:complete len:211 (-),score=3.78 INCI6845.1:10-642(-)
MSFLPVRPRSGSASPSTRNLVINQPVHHTLGLRGFLVSGFARWVQGCRARLSSLPTDTLPVSVRHMRLSLPLLGEFVHTYISPIESLTPRWPHEQIYLIGGRRARAATFMAIWGSVCLSTSQLDCSCARVRALPNHRPIYTLLLIHSFIHNGACPLLRALAYRISWTSCGCVCAVVPEWVFAKISLWKSSNYRAEKLFLASRNSTVDKFT